MNLSKKNKFLFIGIIFIIIIGVFFLVNKKESKFDNKKARLGKVKKDDLIQRITMGGSVVPFRKTIVMAPYSGYVKKMYVKLGDKVKLNDPIVSVVQSLLSSEEVYPLRAPYSGTVVQLEKSEGEYVAENDKQNFILRIDDLSKLYIVANAAEIDIVKIEKQQHAIIKASAVLNRTYKGIIREIALAAKETDSWRRTQTEYAVRIEVLDPDIDLKPGMSAVVDVITDKKEKVLILRHEYIFREKNNYFVTTKEGIKKQIKVGMQNEEAFEITEGVSEGEFVRLVDFASFLENKP